MNLNLYFIFAGLFFLFNLDMIDQVLGFGKPVAARRKKPDAASETSNKQEVTDPVTISPARPIQRRLNNEEPLSQNKDQQEKLQAPVQNQPLARSRQKPVGRLDSKPEPKSQITPEPRQEPKPQKRFQTRAQTKFQRKSEIKSQISAPKKEKKSDTKSQSQEEIASPALKNLRVTKVAKLGGIQQMKGSIKTLKQSLRPVGGRGPQPIDTMYKLKLLAFLIVSFLLVLNAMTPSRKCVYKRK